MKVIHRCDSESRRHFLPEDYSSINLKPRLLYAGVLEKEGAGRKSPILTAFPSWFS